MLGVALAFETIFVVAFFGAAGIGTLDGAGYENGGKYGEGRETRRGAGWSICEFIATCEGHVASKAAHGRLK